MKHLLLDASYSHLHRDHCHSAVNELEGGFSCWGFGCSSVSPQDIGYRDGNFALPHPAPPRKGGRAGMGQYFVPAPWGGVGMGLVFLSPTRPTLPRPVPTLIKTIIVNLVIRMWCHYIGRKRNLFLKNSSIFICYRTMFIFLCLFC